MKLKILCDIGHPAHVHLFKNFLWEMQKRGHKTLITCRDKECTLDLLDNYGFHYVILGKHYKKYKIVGVFKFIWSLLKNALKFKPDILISAGSIYSALVSWIIRKPSISLEDTGNMEQVRFYKPFTKYILTPNVLQLDLGKKQLQYNGFHELAYLHPKYFDSDPSILKMLGVKEGEKFVIIRFVSWDATHDKGHRGLSFEMKRKAIKTLSESAKVFITSEEELPDDLKEYRIKIPPERIHDALYYAWLYFGEGGTMATESALLGTPAIIISTYAPYIGIFNKMSEYGLMYIIPEENNALNKALELIKSDDSKVKARRIKDKLISEKIDVTDFVTSFIENYPQYALD